ncbi:TetR/AcrR family transcriptional regulator [Microbacterium saperdae]|uniref:TetR family transcriptional regulator n=1 Tax=Microbacterium saperdae TaxID=69368 RepID=A0A543BL95_9MICO|nr:TetR family transcriptional regulator C-terminal domain-containing protein [Microbacterium saperdae]TQL85599.1 TetR family transcriptional regulator [Microbacterium saperdae]GGM62368.1 HTH-type transcriptional regulator BetI [Microbacterium saperdae]
MPKIVDHAARRLELADACLRVVSRSGLAGATTREIAREAGVSHGIIAHYFSGKDEILHAALQRSLDLLTVRVDDTVATLVGARALRAALVQAIPSDPSSLTGEQIELAFWGQALTDPRLAAERWQSYVRWRRLLMPLVLEARRLGEMPENVDPSVVVEALIALVDGLGAQAALYPERVAVGDQRAALDAVLRAFGIVIEEPGFSA